MSRVWTAQEQSTTWIESFEAAWLPDSAQDKMRVFSARNGQITGLEIGGWVGSVQLLNGDSLHVQPKIGPAEFFRMLAIAEGLDSRIFDEGLVEYGNTENPVSLSLTLKPFLNSVRRVSASSKVFEWTKRSVVSDSRPQALDLVATTTRIVNRRSQPFVGSVFDRTTDISANRAIAAASAVLLSQFANSLESHELRLLRSWSMLGWADKKLIQDIHSVRNSLASGEYLGSRGYYHQALQLSLIVLGNSGYGLDGKDDSRGAARLINSADIFEKFVRHVIRESVNDLGLVVRKERASARFLFEGGISGIEPDILISRGTKIVLIGDVKYKSATSSDFYQLVAYLDNYGLDHGLLIDASPDASGHRELLRTPSGKSIHRISLPNSPLSNAISSLEDHVRMVLNSI